MTPKSTSQKVLAALIAIQLLFGMNYIFSKVVLRVLPALMWANIRALVTAAILLGYLAFKSKLDWKQVKIQWKQLALFSLVGVTLNQGCFLMGLKFTTATNSSLLSTLIPIFTILMVTLLGQEKSTRRKELGFACAFIGVLVLHNVESFSANSDTLKGDVLTLLNAFFYSLFLVFSQNFMRKNDFFWATAWLFGFGSLSLTLFALPDWLTYQWQPLNNETLFCAVITILFGTVVPYLLISFTLGRAQSSLVALFIYLQPLIAMLLGYSFFHEVITLRMLCAAAFIFGGVFLAISDRKLSRPNRKTPPSAPTRESESNVIPLRRKMK